MRVSLFDKHKGRLGSDVAEYPLHRSVYDPNFATQSLVAQMDALERAMRKALAASNVSGDTVKALAIDTTGFSMIPVGEDLEPLDDYYLPDEREPAVYDKLYSPYRKLHFSLGVPGVPPTQIGHTSSTLRKMASETLEPQ